MQRGGPGPGPGPALRPAAGCGPSTRDVTQKKQSQGPTTRTQDQGFQSDSFRGRQRGSQGAHSTAAGAWPFMATGAAVHGKEARNVRPDGPLSGRAALRENQRARSRIHFYPKTPDPTGRLCLLPKGPHGFSPEAFHQAQAWATPEPTWWARLPLGAARPPGPRLVGVSLCGRKCHIISPKPDNSRVRKHRKRTLFRWQRSMGREKPPRLCFPPERRSAGTDGPGSVLLPDLSKVPGTLWGPQAEGVRLTLLQGHVNTEPLCKALGNPRKSGGPALPGGQHSEAKRHLLLHSQTAQKGGGGHRVG